IDCPDSVQTVNDAGNCSAIVLNLSPVVDPVDSLASLEFFATGATSQTGNDASGLHFEVGTTTVTYVAVSHAGDTATCVFMVEVSDTESPVFTNCNGNDTVSTTNTLCGLLFSGNVLPVADDNCPGLVLTYLPAAGTTLTLGTTPISALATDSAGNQAICTYNITVLDDDAPVISGCPGNISVAAALGQCGANVNWIAPTATDNCQLLAFTPSQAPGSFFPAGNIPTPVEYVAVDNAGNVAKCMFTVTVSDQQPPVFVVCPTVPTVNASPGNCSAIVTWALPAVSDNCGVISLNGNQIPGSFDVGSTTATYTALDAAGNSATCNFTITVMDNQFPVFSGVPQDMTVLAEPGLCGATVNWNPPTANDNCGIVSVQGSETPGSFFDAGSEVEVEYTAVDENGNVTVVSFTIEVLDVIPPVFNCPEDVTISTDGSILNDPSGVIISLQPIDCENIQLSYQQPSVTDDCGISSVVQTEGLASGSIFTTGTVDITFLATDNNGNPNTCHFDIVVED
ncbi:MAG: HYR domain-containing protein, partial [Acidobacteriota bacterium]